MKNIKEKLQKIGKFIISRMFYLILGICIAVAIPIAYAAWNTLVNPGETLTAAGWNEHVNKLIELDSRWSSEFANCYNVSISRNGSAGCNPGYVITAIRNGLTWADVANDWHWDAHVNQITCCKIR